MYYNESSYYRANPFYRQGFLPDRAFVNRRVNEHLVQLPQGDSHFDPTTRKHFQVSDKSEIHENAILYHPDETFKPTVAVQKEFQRNLETKDIEGAVSNTLVSPVVRNRMRSQQLKQIYEASDKIKNAVPANHYYVPPTRERKEEMVKLYKQQSSLLNGSHFNESTPSSTANKRNYHMRDRVPSPKYRQSTQAVRPIPNSQSQQLQRSLDIQQRNYRPNPVQINQSLDKYQEGNAAEKKLTINLNQPQDSLKTQINEQRLRRISQNKEQRPEPYHTIEQPLNMVAARRINPTFLSYGSNPFNLVAKNIIQQ